MDDMSWVPTSSAAPSPSPRPSSCGVSRGRAARAASTSTPVTPRSSCGSTSRAPRRCPRCGSSGRWSGWRPPGRRRHHRPLLRAPLPVAQPRDRRRTPRRAPGRGNGPAAEAAQADPHPARDQRAPPEGEEAALGDQAGTAVRAGRSGRGQGSDPGPRPPAAAASVPRRPSPGSCHIPVPPSVKALTTDRDERVRQMSADDTDFRDVEFLARRFEAHRGHLRAVAHRMLGSTGEAEDAVQEAWFRVSRSDTSRVDNLGGWLTTVVGRVCLDMLRRASPARRSLWTTAQPGSRAAGSPVDRPRAGRRPRRLRGRRPARRTGHPDARRAAGVRAARLFGVPYEEVGAVVDRTPAAARQLASRARRRVQGAEVPGAGRARRRRQREIVEAFLAAARDGDSRGCSMSWTRTSSRAARPGWQRVRWRWRGVRRPTGPSPGSRGPRSSTVPRGSWCSSRGGWNGL